MNQSLREKAKSIRKKLSADDSSDSSEDDESEHRLHDTYQRFKVESMYMADFKNALKFWSHEPLLTAYFSKGELDHYD